MTHLKAYSTAAGFFKSSLGPVMQAANTATPNNHPLRPLHPELCFARPGSIDFGEATVPL